MGRPPHEPSEYHRRQVEAMAGYGIPEIDIARVIGVDPKTLRKHYREELDIGHVKANSAVAQSLFRKATGDGPQSVTAAIFWAKTRMGWRERDEPARQEETTVVIQRFAVDWGHSVGDRDPVFDGRRQIEGTASAG